MSSMEMRTLHTIVYKEGDHFIASGVELDIFAQGKTQAEAESRLEVVLNAEIREANDAGRDLFDLGPAPDSVVARFRRDGDDIVSQDERVFATDG